MQNSFHAWLMIHTNQRHLAEACEPVVRRGLFRDLFDYDDRKLASRGLLGGCEYLGVLSLGLGSRYHPDPRSREDHSSRQGS